MLTSETYKGKLSDSDEVQHNANSDSELGGKMDNLHVEATQSQNPNKVFTIVVNGQEKFVAEKELTFAGVVALAFPNPPTGPDVLFTVTYRRGEGDKPEGTLVAGQQVKVKDGMIFNVTPTNKS